jgi:hypothetical protein
MISAGLLSVEQTGKLEDPLGQPQGPSRFMFARNTSTRLLHLRFPVRP